MSKSKSNLSKFFVFFLPLLLSCTLPSRFIQLTDDHGGTRRLYLESESCFLIVIDSVQVDSLQFQLFSRKRDFNGSGLASSYWRINSFDSLHQTIEFKNCQDMATIVLQKKQIAFIKPVPGVIITARNALDIVTIPAFVLGTIGTAWGLISLPFPSTPRKEDLKLIRGGVIALGIFGFATLIAEPAQTDSVGNKYRIDSIH